MLPVIKSEDGNVTTIVNGCQPYSFNKNHINYDLLLKAIDSGDNDNFIKYHDVGQGLQKSIDKHAIDKDIRLSVKNGQVLCNGEVVNNFVCDRILEAFRTNGVYKNLVNFLKKLLNNPSRRAIEQLYSFLEHKGLPITDDGDFIAWKSVNKDYLDKYTGKINNSVGSIVEIARNKVDDDYNNECSHGLHVGCLEYSGPGGWYNKPDDKVLAVKVNPQDAVAVPADHNFTKLRVCRYEVIGEYKASPVSSFASKSNANEFINNLDGKNWYNADTFDDDEFCLTDDNIDRIKKNNLFSEVSSPSYWEPLEDEDEDDEDEFLDDPQFENKDIRLSVKDDKVVCNYDLAGYVEGDKVEFVYTKPDGTSRLRKVLIDFCSKTHVNGFDLDCPASSDSRYAVTIAGNVCTPKSFKISRIDLKTVKATK